ncbi:MAG: DUF1501 domain-containing protein, partial [Planctomyces sp.]
MLSPRYILNRRSLLSVGAAGVAGTVVGRAAGSTTAEARPARSVLVVMLSGGPSQLDTFDPKPNAPLEIRGEFSSISTAIAGISVCEHLPLLAARMSDWAIVRSMAHKEHNHLLATHV